MSSYSAPIPPLQATTRAPRTGTYDRHGNPQDVVEGRIVTSAPPRPAPQPAAVLPPRRSVLLAVLLAAFLGPIGLLYSSRLGALATATFFMVFGFPFMLLWPDGLALIAVPTMLMSIGWAFVASTTHNAALAMHRSLIHLAQ